MGRMYVATFAGVSVSAVQDLFELTLPATCVVQIHRAEITNDASETSEQLPIQLRRGVGSTSGSGGSTATPAKLGGTGDPASTVTVEINNTTVMSAGTITTLARRGFNVLSGWLYAPTPEERIVLSPSERLSVHLPTAPSAAITLSGEVVFEELG